MSNISPGTLPSVMKHDFSKVPKAEIPRSNFNRSCGFKTTLNSGDLVPIFVDEVLPGDTFKLSSALFGRMSTPIVPFMDNVTMDTFFFFIPNRLVWNNFQKFMGEQDNPGDSTSYLLPTATSVAGTGYLNGSLQDNMGIPPGIAGITHVNLPMRGYNLLWNQWFRDQNLQNSVTVDKGDGPDTPANYVTLKRGKRHDYFTSALPWTQKATAVTIPLGTSAPVKLTTPGAAQQIRNRATGALASVAENVRTSAAGVFQNAAGTYDAQLDPNGTMYADLSTATAATINSLRQAFQIQKLYERDARGGTRYTEVVRAHWGVTSPDARLQRAEYLGGGSTPINVNPIPQTSSTDATTPQGNLSANATMSATGHGFTKSFVEHGYIIGLVNIRADLNYQQGLNRMWSRSTRLDLAWPVLSHIGEQDIKNIEIYAQGTAGGTADAGVFGYQERFAEYRYNPSRISGQFRSTYSTPLDIWHAAQKFTALPVLNATFISENPAIQRLVSVKSPYPEFLLDVYHNLSCARALPTYGVPGLIDHF